MCVQTRQSRVPRSGFTLIELLIVIAIITILFALSLGVYFSVMGSSAKNSAAVVVTRVQKALASQYDKVKKEAEKEPLPPPAANTALNNGYSTVLTNLAGGDPPTARVIWVKLRLKQAFPMNFTEARNPIMFGEILLPSLYANKLPAVSTLTPAQENAVCLKLALERTVSGGVAPDAISNMTTKQFGTTSSTVGLVDPFGTPLAFCRWPTGSIDLNPSGAQAGFNDPEDRQGTLMNATWLANFGSNFVSICHSLPLTATGVFDPTSSFKLQPLVISAGPDTILGLDPTSFTPLSPPDPSFDNVVAKITP